MKELSIYIMFVLVLISIIICVLTNYHRRSGGPKHNVDLQKVTFLYLNMDHIKTCTKKKYIFLHPKIIKISCGN